jgi:hypothetical protein
LTLSDEWFSHDFISIMNIRDSEHSLEVFAASPHDYPIDAAFAAGPKGVNDGSNQIIGRRLGPRGSDS